MRLDERAVLRIEDADCGGARLKDLAVAELRFMRAALLLAPFGNILEQEPDAVGWDREGRDRERPVGIVLARSFTEVCGDAGTHDFGELLRECRPRDGRKVLIEALPEAGGRDVGDDLRGRVHGDDTERRRVGRIFEAQDGHADRSTFEKLLGKLTDLSKAVRTHRIAARDMVLRSTPGRMASWSQTQR